MIGFLDAERGRILVHEIDEAAGQLADVLAGLGGPFDYLVIERPV